MPVPDFVDTERTVEVPWIEQQLRGVHARALLDVGSAEGFYFRALAATGAEITLLEQHPFSLYHLHPARIAVVFGDVTRLPPAWSGRFDVVTCVSTLDHVGLNPRDVGALSRAADELARVTLGGVGRLLLTVPAGEDQVAPHRDGWPQRVFSLATLMRLFDEERWYWRSHAAWKRCGERYEPCGLDDLAGCGYASYRAEGVLALDLDRRR